MPEQESKYSFPFLVLFMGSASKAEHVYISQARVLIWCDTSNCVSVSSPAVLRLHSWFVSVDSQLCYFKTTGLLTVTQFEV